VCPLRQRCWGWVRLELCLKFLFIQNEESKPKEDNIDFSWKLIWNQTRLMIASCVIVIKYIQAHLFDWKPIIYYVYFYLKMIGKIEIRKNEMAEIKVKTLGNFATWDLAVLSRKGKVWFRSKRPVTTSIVSIVLYSAGQQSTVEIPFKRHTAQKSRLTSADI
jgi:hypothetical protein